MTKKCDKCEFCVLQDYGYSNYTVEGTYVHCSLNLHPEKGFDRFYGDDERLKFAEECASYRKGSPVEVDVDGEIELSPEELIKARAVGARP